MKEEEKNEEDVEVISLKEEPICEVKEDIVNVINEEEPVIEEMKKSRKTRKIEECRNF